MSMNNIALSLLGNLLPIREGENVVKAEAWRKAFDKEQDEILKNIKSVKSGNANEIAKDESAPFIARQVKPANTLVNQPSGEQSQIQTGDELPHSNLKSQPQSATLLPDRAASGVSSFDYLTMREAKIASTTASSSYSNLNEGELASAIALLESHYKNKWPLKNVHMVPTDQGVKVWIRDVNLTGHREIQALIDRIKLALQKDGYELAGFVLNGKTIH